MNQDRVEWAIQEAHSPLEAYSLTQALNYLKENPLKIESVLETQMWFLGIQSFINKRCNKSMKIYLKIQQKIKRIKIRNKGN